MQTEKIYYKNQFQSSCKAKLIGKTKEGLIFDKTVAYPEGGGQIGDKGKLIRTKNNEMISFVDTRKIMGRTIYLDDFPIINVEDSIVHILEAEYEDYEIGEEFIIKINISERANATLNHSAIHLALMILEELRPGIDKKIVGAKITNKYGRLDFLTTIKFSQEEIKIIQNKAQEYIELNIPIIICSHPKEVEAMYWKCLDYSVPCGGTHCNTTNQLGMISVKRKNIGKSADRLIIELKNIEKFSELYGDENDKKK